MSWRDISSDQNLRLANTLLEKQGEINRLTAELHQMAAERDRWWAVVRAAQVWRDQFARPAKSEAPPRHKALCEAVDAYESALDGNEMHPESRCARCGGPNIAWSAPSPLWNEVMRGGDINAADRFDGIVCPTCFAVLAEDAGVAEFWRFYADRVHRELTTVTPSGRTWNKETWLWEEPVLDADDRCPRCGGLDGTHTVRACGERPSVADPVSPDAAGEAVDHG